jgi:hypothetical protein
VLTAAVLPRAHAEHLARPRPRLDDLALGELVANGAHLALATHKQPRQCSPEGPDARE